MFIEKLKCIKYSIHCVQARTYLKSHDCRSVVNECSVFLSISLNSVASADIPPLTLTGLSPATPTALSHHPRQCTAPHHTTRFINSLTNVSTCLL